MTHTLDSTYAQPADGSLLFLIVFRRMITAVVAMSDQSRFALAYLLNHWC